MKTITILLLCALGVGGGDDNPLELRIKPNVTTRGLDVTIGELCELSQTTGQAVALAKIKFGSAPVNGFARNVSRTEIVQSLAAAGVDLSTIKILGSDEAVVQSVVVEVSGPEMIEAATVALQAQLQVEGGDVEFETPGNLRHVQAPPGRKSLELSARVRGTRTGPNSAVVDVDLLVDGQSYRKIPVQFRLQRFHHVLKTSATVREGDRLGPDNLVVSREPIDQINGLYLDRFEQVEGLIAARNLQSSQRLTIADTAPPALVHRGDIVTVVLTRGRVKVTARAIANSDAPLGGRVTVTNTDSRGTITGIVYGTGLVLVQQ